PDPSAPGARLAGGERLQDVVGEVARLVGGQRGPLTTTSTALTRGPGARPARARAARRPTTGRRRARRACSPAPARPARRGSPRAARTAHPPGAPGERGGPAGWRAARGRSPGRWSASREIGRAHV